MTIMSRGGILPYSNEPIAAFSLPMCALRCFFRIAPVGVYPTQKNI